MDILKKVCEMHDQFGISGQKFSDSEKRFRLSCLLEEVDEYRQATNKADELDAMVDLIIFALGTIDRQGMASKFYEAFDLVMEANCKKQVGGNRKRGDFQLDLFKPEGWAAPDLTTLVGDK